MVQGMSTATHEHLDEVVTRRLRRAAYRAADAGAQSVADDLLDLLETYRESRAAAVDRDIKPGEEDRSQPPPGWERYGYRPDGMVRRTEYVLTLVDAWADHDLLTAPYREQAAAWREWAGIVARSHEGDDTALRVAVASRIKADIAAARAEGLREGEAGGLRKAAVWCNGHAHGEKDAGGRKALGFAARTLGYMADKAAAAPASPKAAPPEPGTVGEVEMHWSDHYGDRVGFFDSLSTACAYARDHRIQRPLIGRRGGPCVRLPVDPEPQAPKAAPEADDEPCDVSYADNCPTCDGEPDPEEGCDDCDGTGVRPEPASDGSGEVAYELWRQGAEPSYYPLPWERLHESVRVAWDAAQKATDAWHDVAPPESWNPEDDADDEPPAAPPQPSRERFAAAVERLDAAESHPSPRSPEAAAPLQGGRGRERWVCPQGHEVTGDFKGNCLTCGDVVERHVGINATGVGDPSQWVVDVRTVLEPHSPDTPIERVLAYEVVQRRRAEGKLESLRALLADDSEPHVWDPEGDDLTKLGWGAVVLARVADLVRLRRSGARAAVDALHPAATPTAPEGPTTDLRWLREGLNDWANRLLVDRSGETVEAAVRALWLYRDVLDGSPAAPQGPCLACGWALLRHPEQHEEPPLVRGALDAQAEAERKGGHYHTLADAMWRSLFPGEPLPKHRQVAVARVAALRLDPATPTAPQGPEPGGVDARADEVLSIARFGDAVEAEAGPAVLVTIKHALAIASAALTFGQVQRATLHPDGTPESDATHTVMLALLVGDLARREGLDPGLAVQFAVVHDVPETYAGDTCTARGLSPDAAAEKAAREAASLERLRAELGPCWTTDMVDRYEAQREPEARLVRYLDKVLPKLTHVLNGGLALAEIGMSAREVETKHAEQGAKLRALYPEMIATRALFDEACALALDAMRKREAASPLPKNGPEPSIAALPPGCAAPTPEAKP